MVAEHTAVGRLVLVLVDPEEGLPLVAKERPSCLVLVWLETFCQFDFWVELEEGIFADPQSCP